MTIKIKEKYFRIHIKDDAYHTKKPKGLFVAIGNLVDREVLTPDEVEEYWKNRRWFEEELPIPPFYEDGNSIKGITWYKNNNYGIEMFNKMDFYINMAKKYNVDLYLTQTSKIPGEVIYEDDYQIGVVDSSHSGELFMTSEYSV